MNELIKIKEGHFLSPGFDENLKKVLGGEIDVDNIIVHIKSEETAYYVDINFRLAENESDENCYAIYDTGIKLYDGQALFISLIRNSDGTYAGNFVGTSQRIASGVQQFYNSDPTVIAGNLNRFNQLYRNRRNLAKANGKNAIIETGNVDRVVSQVYNDQLIKYWERESGLKRYIHMCGCRLSQLVEERKSEYYITNRSHTMAIINSGMYSTYGIQVFILYKYFAKKRVIIEGKLTELTNVYEVEDVFESKRQLVEKYDFTKEELDRLERVKAIKFYEDNCKLTDLRYEDFDLNAKCLEHMLKDNISRIPIHLRNMTLDQLAEKIRSELKLALKILEIDSTFAKPSYSCASREISWYLPLHIQAAFAQRPEMVMVIKKAGEYYEVKTIFENTEQIDDRIHALELYEGYWNNSKSKH